MGSTLPKNIKTLERTQRQAAICCTYAYSSEPGTASSYKLDTLQKYFETASSQPQLKNVILYPQALSQANH